MSLRADLPPIYERLLPEFFDSAAPREEKATCASCAMCAPPGAPASAEYFRPDTKCCTYHPTLPNYLAGAVLADESLAEGQRRIAAQIARGVGVTPRWLAAPRKLTLLLEASRARAFGRSLSLRCPYYVEDGGLCSIWRHREADCSTFFCKYDAGAHGQRFWRSLGDYLRLLERTLSRHALVEVAPELADRGDVPAGQLTVEDLEDRPPAHYGALWGGWRGREAELYRRCHEVVSALAPDSIKAIVNPAEHDEALAALVAANDARTSPSLPPRLVLAGDLVRRPVEGGELTVGYSRYEPLFLSTALVELLENERHDELPPELLLQLFQAEVLVPA